MSSTETSDRPDRPDWDDDPYLDRVAERLMYNFDLEKDVSAGGERFDLGGELRIEREKHFLHPSLNYANHESREYLYARRDESVTVSELERLAEAGSDLAEDRFEVHDEHFSTDVTFAVIVPDVPSDVADYVEAFSGRTLVRWGFGGHYEINLVVAAPEAETLVASENADVGRAFRTWEPIEPVENSGLLRRIARKLRS